MKSFVIIRAILLSSAFAFIFSSCSKSVKITPPTDPLYVGSYSKLKVAVSGYSFDNLEFKVSDAAGGEISYSRDASFSSSNPDIMYLAGYKPGTYKVSVMEKGSSTVLDEKTVEVTDTWKDKKDGPPFWFNEVVSNQAYGAAWGGGGSGVQNFSTIPATGTRKIAIVLIDTDSDRYTTDAAVLDSIKKRWKDEISDGLNVGGTMISTRKYYQEVSDGNFDIQADVFGPVSLPNGFKSYFSLNTTRNIWAPGGSYYQSAITAADGLVNYNNYQSLLFVSKSWDDSSFFAWPYASICSWGPYTTAEGNFNFGVSSMPVDWEIVDGRMIYQTYTHEFGHNLCMGDQYNPDVPGRNPGHWEMMHADGRLPHFSLAHRLMLGWVDPSDVQTFDFATLGTGVNQNIQLHPVEDDAVPSGRKRGAEVRLSDGWNYYFEYRKSQTGDIGDQNLPTDSRVLGTDVASQPYTPPFARPAILLLNNDADGDGPILGNGQDYKETDFSDPVYPAEFKATVSGINGSKADLNISYGVNGKPDPSIRPWPASADRQWQSPDIEVQNARNQADPSWFNCPWVGEDNTIIARVKNNGNISAPQVRVNFYVKDFNTGPDVPKALIGFDVQDIPPGATVNFTTNWVPPSGGHYCVEVRIPLYQTPGTAPTVEMTELNNLAQSNYTKFVSGTASPASRELTEIAVNNPYDKPTRIFFAASQSNPYYRTYLEHSWMWIDANSSRKMKVMLEYAPDGQQQKDIGNNDKYYRDPNDVKFQAFIEDPTTKELHTAYLTGGLEATVVTGRKTKIDGLEYSDNGVMGRVTTVDDNSGVPGGKVILIGTDTNGEKSYGDGKVDNTGNFSAPLPGKRIKEVKAYYVPAPGFGDCESTVLPIKN